MIWTTAVKAFIQLEQKLKILSRDSTEKDKGKQKIQACSEDEYQEDEYQEDEYQEDEYQEDEYQEEHYRMEI
ncbi:hypothetical protein STEG23_001484 [Scotinomys teguina]